MDFSALESLSEEDLSKYYNDITEYDSLRLSQEGMVVLNTYCTGTHHKIVGFVDRSVNYDPALPGYCSHEGSISFTEVKTKLCGGPSAGTVCVSYEKPNVELKVTCNNGRIGYTQGFAIGTAGNTGYCAGGDAEFWEAKFKVCGYYSGYACVTRRL